MLNYIGLDMYDDDYKGKNVDHRIIIVSFENFLLLLNIHLQGPPLDVLLNICPQPPYIKDMKDMQINNCIFMIKVNIIIVNRNVFSLFKQPFKYDLYNPNREPVPINSSHRYIDGWNEHHVRMPCSPSNISVSQIKSRFILTLFPLLKTKGEVHWPIICQLLFQLKRKCDSQPATMADLKVIILNLDFYSNAAIHHHRKQLRVALNAITIWIVSNTSLTK